MINATSVTSSTTTGGTATAAVYSYYSVNRSVRNFTAANYSAKPPLPPPMGYSSRLQLRFWSSTTKLSGHHNFTTSSGF